MARRASALVFRTDSSRRRVPLPRTLAFAAALVAALAAAPGAARAQAADSAAQERAARALLGRLVGEWAFEWRGQSGAGSVAMTGTRAYRLLPDSLHLAWDEAFDAPRQTAHGVLWYHPGERRLFYFGLYAPGGGATFLLGRLATSGEEVTFELAPVGGDSLPVNRGLVRSRLRLLATGAHEWTRWDEGWVVTFRRR